MNTIPEPITECIKRILSNVPEDHRAAGERLLKDAWALGIAVLDKKPAVAGVKEYQASWHCVKNEGQKIWMGTFLVVAASSRDVASL